MTLAQKLKDLNFLPDLDNNLSQTNLLQIESFVNRKIENLFQKKSKLQIQQTIDQDTDPVIVNYLTHIVEVGSVLSVARNGQGEKTRKALESYLHVMVWAYNLAMAKSFVDRGILNIPAIGNGTIDIYYSDNALLQIVDRIVHHISMGTSEGTERLILFATVMVEEHLEL